MSPGDRQIQAGIRAVDLEHAIFYWDGDHVDLAGYVNSLRVDSRAYAPVMAGQGPTALANNVLERRTACLVKVSTKEDADAGVKEFRILYEFPQLQGEALAASMAMIACLKSAFINRSKIMAHGVAARTEVSFLGGTVQSDLFFELGSVELLSGS